MNMGLTALNKHCRKLGITRWPHWKVKSLHKLIDNVQVSASRSTTDFKFVSTSKNFLQSL